MIKPIILQFHRRFFARTETFIYNYITRLEQFQPLCCARRYINLSDFPLKDNYFFSPKMYPLHRYSNIYAYLLKKTSINCLPFRWLDKIPIKLIHAHFGPQGVTALQMKAKWGIPLCTTFYGYDVSQRAKQKKWKKLYQKLFKEGDLFLAEGPFMKKCLINIGCPEHKIQIQRIAIPLDKIPFLPRFPKKNSEKINILFCASFTEKKGHIYALKAIKLAQEKNKNFILKIIGSGSLGNEIKKFIKLNLLGKCVEISDQLLPYSKYLQILNTADIFIHPSITAKDGDSEGGAPTAILEAQAMGIPILSTYHADIPNIVVPKESALLSPEKDYESLANNLLTLLQNQDQWKKMGQCGRDFVETWHDVNKETPSLEEKYFHLINK